MCIAYQIIAAQHVQCCRSGFFNSPFSTLLHVARPPYPDPRCYNFHTRRLLNTHANTHTPNAYAANTAIARPSEAYIVRIDKFTAPVATLACRGKQIHTFSTTTNGRGKKTRTRRKTASAFRFIASSSGGAGIGLGPDVVDVVIVVGPVRYGCVRGEAESIASSSLSSSSSLLWKPLGRRTTLRPETGEYVLLASGVGKKARSRSR